MSDLSAGKTEITKELQRVITNAESFRMKASLDDQEKLSMAINMLYAARRMISEAFDETN